MEHNMVENEWIYITKQFFLKELPKFHLKSSNSYGPYWNIEFVDCNIAVEIGGDIGFHIQIYIYDSKHDLCQYDRSVNDKMKTTKENILYQLNILKRFLYEVI